MVKRDKRLMRRLNREGLEPAIAWIYNNLEDGQLIDELLMEHNYVFEYTALTFEDEALKEIRRLNERIS